MDKKAFIKNLISINNDANASIIALESDIQAIKIEDDKDKANFGNLCVMLRGYRMVADASEAMLVNENVLKGEDGSFYQKIDENIIPPTTEGKPGSDYDIDKKTQL